MLTPEEEFRKAKLLQELKDLEDGARAKYISEAKEASKRYSFSDVTDPNVLATLQRFQHVFGRYFPHLLRSEAKTITLHQRLRNGIFMNPVQTINKSTFEADLKRFKGAVKVLADWPIWGAMTHFGGGPMEMGLRDDQQMTDVEQAALEIFRCILTVADVADDMKLPQVLNQLERWARATSQIVPDRRNINWAAVHAVDRLLWHWEANTESFAPRRALNPASPFADYLRDAFEFFSVSGDPIAAFKRWVVVQDADQ